MNCQVFAATPGHLRTAAIDAIFGCKRLLGFKVREGIKNGFHFKDDIAAFAPDPMAGGAGGRWTVEEEIFTALGIAGFRAETGGGEQVGQVKHDGGRFRDERAVVNEGGNLLIRVRVGGVFIARAVHARDIRVDDLAIRAERCGERRYSLPRRRRLAGEIEHGGRDDEVKGRFLAAPEQRHERGVVQVGGRRRGLRERAHDAGAEGEDAGGEGVTFSSEAGLITF